MITSFSITNYALIERLEITISKGFTAITGETGAGKSILLGALSLVLGKRADTTVLRNKEKKCTVEAGFDISTLSLHPFFKENDLDYDDLTLLRREILPSGKSRAFINDTPVSLQIMKELGEQLVDVHSQHQTLLLGKTDFQLALLDDFSNNHEILPGYKEHYHRMTELKKRVETLQKEKEDAENEEEFLRFQLQELETAKDTLEHFDELREEEKMLAHTEEIASGVSELTNILSEDDFSVISKMARAKEILAGLSAYHSKAEELFSRMESVWIELKDIVSELEITGSDISINPARAEELTQLLDSVYRLQQKHRVNSAEELLQLMEELKRRLEKTEHVQTDLEEAEKLYGDELKTAQELASELTKIRMKAAQQFEKKIESLLKRLGMPHATFSIEISNSGKLTETGENRVRFLFSANKGAKVEEIAKTASGGELSRLMLALKAMVQQAKLLPTVIFDEIDSGVSGSIAGKIGSILKEMSANLQVIAITHLPQIAAKADTHLKVFKEVVNEHTETRLVFLDEKERIYELASLISSNEVTPAALDAAKELMKG